MERLVHVELVIRCVLVGTICGAAPWARCDTMVLKERFRASLPLHTPVNVVIGRLNGETLYCVQGDVVRDGRRIAAVAVVDSAGHTSRTFEEPGPTGNSQAGAYLHWIAGDDGPMVLFSWVPDSDAVPGGANLVRLRDGEVVARIRNTTRFGNNNSMICDLDGDGRTDLLYADQRTLSLHALPDANRRWRVDTGIHFCWSLPALVDLPGKRQAIVFGSEYNNPDGTSSLVALDMRGNVLWRTDGHAEDLGSTPVAVADVDGDGTDELLKVGLDLEHRQAQEWNHLHVFSKTGALRSRVALGFTGIAIANFDGDPALEGIGISNSRDGGSNGRREIRCMDLASGKLEWARPVDRVYLDDTSPVAGDFNGDGTPDAVVGTGNPAGYARLPDSEPWGEQYVVSNTGDILQRIKLPGRPVNSALCDTDGDGLAELITVIDGAPGSLVVYATGARSARRDWPTPFGSVRRDGTIWP